MKTQFPLYIVIAGIGVVIGLLLHQPSAQQAPAQKEPATQTQAVADPATSSNTKSTAQSTDAIDRLGIISKQLEQLQNTLKQETASRKDLQQQVAHLKDDLKLLASAKAATANESKDNVLSTRPVTNASQNSQWFNSQALVDAGVEQSEADHIQQVYEDVEMQKLYLRDKAVREGWIGQDRYQQERAKLDNKLDGLRDELGDKGYDAYLYASGQPNRVTIVSALDNSPASKAGIQAGDTVLSYDSKRIYSWSDLRQATTQGQPNALVAVELIRNGTPVTVYVPRGPLGVQLDTQSVAPP